MHMTQDFYKRLKHRINQPGLFSASNGIEVTECGLHYANGELTLSPSSLNPRGIVHGGCLSTLMDTVAGIAACTDGWGCVTLNCTVSYLRAVQNTKKVYCKANAVKTGRTIAVYQAELFDDNGTLVANGTYTFFLKGTRGQEAGSDRRRQGD
jgi:acyl-CoA thioesterase